MVPHFLSKGKKKKIELWNPFFFHIVRSIHSLYSVPILLKTHYYSFHTLYTIYILLVYNIALPSNIIIPCRYRSFATASSWYPHIFIIENFHISQFFPFFFRKNCFMKKRSKAYILPCRVCSWTYIYIGGQATIYHNFSTSLFHNNNGVAT